MAGAKSITVVGAARLEDGGFRGGTWPRGTACLRLRLEEQRRVRVVQEKEAAAPRRIPASTAGHRA